MAGIAARDRMCRNCSLAEEVYSHAKNGTILLMMVDSGYYYQFLNSYYIGNLRMYDNLLVVCLDIKSFNKLTRLHVPSVFFKKKINTYVEQFTVQGSPLFVEKMRLKLDIILTALLNGFNVLYMDSDIVLRRDPFPYLFGLESYDMLVQRDVSICAGFMFLYARDPVIRLVKLAASYKMDDQPALNRAYKETNEMKLLFLPENVFSSGKVFWGTHSFYWDPIDPQQIMIHNNYIRYRELKDYRLKEMHLYALDIDGEYSNPNARYLTIETISGLR